MFILKQIILLWNYCIQMLLYLFWRMLNLFLIWSRNGWVISWNMLFWQLGTMIMSRQRTHFTAWESDFSTMKQTNKLSLCQYFVLFMAAPTDFTKNFYWVPKFTKGEKMQKADWKMLRQITPMCVLTTSSNFAYVVL